MLTLLNIKERKDGSADVEFAYTKDFSDLVKKYYKKKRCSKKMMRDFITKGLINYINR